MNFLIMMLKNTKETTYYPIYYREAPFPSNDHPIIRFKSGGHRTIGFKDRNEALISIEEELIKKLPVEYKVIKDLDNDLIWDGIDLPVDIQLREKEQC